MAQQTAVEWLVEQICTSEMSNFIFHQEIKQAKAMEKEQIVNAYNQNITGFDKLEQEEIGLNWAEDYYNETYNK